MKTSIHNQLVKITHHAIVPAVALALLAAPAANAALVKFTPGAGESFSQNVIITQGTTGNGSLETGSTSGGIWFAISPSSFNAVDSRSTDGDWSLRVFRDATPNFTSRVDHRRRNIGLDFTDGDVFHITFDYYVPSTNGYNQLIITPITYIGNTVGTVGAIENISAITTADAWVSVDLYWQLDTNDGFNGMETRFEFRRNGGAEGTYEGFIDNVVITQGVVIPEPSSLALVALAALTCLGFRRRNRIPRFKSSKY